VARRGHAMSLEREHDAQRNAISEGLRRMLTDASS
jgi:hypothetical protein